MPKEKKSDDAGGTYQPSLFLHSRRGHMRVLPLAHVLAFKVKIPLRPSSAKAKGRRLQDHVKTRVLETFTDLEEDDVKTAIMGESGEDVHLSPAARKLFPFSVEAKNQESIQIWRALEQAAANVKDGSTPLVVFKRNRSKVYVALEFEHLLTLLYSKEG